MKKMWKSMNHKKQQPEVADRSFFRSLFLSVLSIVVCMICLVSATWAWVSDSIENKGGVIQTANYDIEVTVTEKTVTVNDVMTTDAAAADTDGNVVTGQGKNYQLQGNTEYMITLKAAGTATTGYCVVTVGDTVYHTAQIHPEDTLSFYLIPAADSNVSFAAQWGTYSGEPEITENITIGNLVSSTEENNGPDEQPGQTEEKEEDSAVNGQEEPSADADSGAELSEKPEESNSDKDRLEQTTEPPKSDSGTEQQEQAEEPAEENNSGEMQPNQPEE